MEKSVLQRSTAVTVPNHPAASRPVQAVPPAVPPSALGLIIGLGVLLLIVYGPLLNWLIRIGFQVDQLSTGGVLVMFVVAVCVRRALRRLTVRPRVTNQGMLLLASAILCLAAVSYLQYLVTNVTRWVLPFVMISFCLSLAAMISFLLGRAGVRAFAPAFGAVLVFGLLAGMFPTLDWPMRSMAGRYAANLLREMNVPVQLGVIGLGAPELSLMVEGHRFIVATECNGFGLLTSSLILAASLAFFYRSTWWNRLGLVMLAMPIAIGCNFLRIVCIALFAPRLPFSYYLVHEAFGLFFYYMGLGFIWILAKSNSDVPAPPPVTTPAVPQPIG